jgi:hypothetical protein
MLKSLRSRADLRFATIANCRAFLAGGFIAAWAQIPKASKL